jgi:hypothetical protein
MTAVGLLFFRMLCDCFKSRRRLALSKSSERILSEADPCPFASNKLVRKPKARASNPVKSICPSRRPGSTHSCLIFWPCRTLVMTIRSTAFRTLKWAETDHRRDLTGYGRPLVQHLDGAVVIGRLRLWLANHALQGGAIKNDHHTTRTDQSLYNKNIGHLEQ